MIWVSREPLISSEFSSLKFWAGNGFCVYARLNVLLGRMISSAWRPRLIELLGIKDDVLPFASTPSHSLPNVRMRLAGPAASPLSTTISSGWRHHKPRKGTQRVESPSRRGGSVVVTVRREAGVSRLRQISSRDAVVLPSSRAGRRSG